MGMLCKLTVIFFFTFLQTLMTVSEMTIYLISGLRKTKSTRNSL